VLANVSRVEVPGGTAQRHGESACPAPGEAPNETSLPAATPTPGHAEAGKPAEKAGHQRAGFEQFGRIYRFSALDGLRALSVIAIIWHHTSGLPGPVFLSRGYFAVDLFFAISGFLITTLLIREYNNHDRISLRKFYIRRTLRIFPLYYLTLLFCIATTLAHTSRRNDPVEQRFLHNLPSFATYTSNWVVEQGDKFYFAWTLATEEQFYLLWPPLLIAALAIGRRKVWVPLTVLAVLVVISEGARFVVDTSTLPGRIPASLQLSILLSAAAALLASNRRGFAILASVLGRRWSAPATALILVAAIAFAPVTQLVVFLIVALVVSVCLVDRTQLHPLLQWRPLAFIGVISYGVYLFHMLCANTISAALHQTHGLVLFGVTLVAVSVAAHLSFRYFETPILRLKRRFETNDQRDGDELSRMTAKSDRTRTPRRPRAQTANVAAAHDGSHVPAAQSQT
jgi:peptidoglycan/LPS O-acetylase OafA/YrhL